jgi:hypothetical protein
MRQPIPAAFVLLLATALPAAPSGLFPPARMDVLVDGSPRPKYTAVSSVYIEALKNREYEIRLYNPYPVRVAVALSVDGLNTIDARHTTALAARKWVIEPYGAITISGWQTSFSEARRFQFTTEDQSYGQALGRTADLGVITAVFFRERVVAPRPIVAEPSPWVRNQAQRQPEARPDTAGGAAAAPPSQKSAGLGASAVSESTAQATDYAATGIGRRTDNAVREVHLDLEETAAATISLRYEYRPQLVRLGILPERLSGEDPLDRRQRAQGFAPGFCPDIKREP